MNRTRWAALAVVSFLVATPALAQVNFGTPLTDTFGQGPILQRIYLLRATGLHRDRQSVDREGAGVSRRIDAACQSRNDDDTSGCKFASQLSGHTEPIGGRRSRTHDAYARPRQEFDVSRTPK